MQREGPGAMQLSELRTILARWLPALHERALVLDHLLEPAAFLGDVFVLPRLGRLGDAVDITLIDADELDAFSLELLQSIDIHNVDVHPRLDRGHLGCGFALRARVRIEPVP